jgi:hypothetical protein
MSFPHPGIRQHETLENFGLTGSDLDRLVESLARTDECSWRAVCSAVYELGSAAKSGLVRGLQRENPRIRLGAADLRQRTRGLHRSGSAKMSHRTS